MTNQLASPQHAAIPSPPSSFWTAPFAVQNLRISLLLLLVLALLCANAPASAQKPASIDGAVSGQAIYNLTAQLLAVAPRRFNGSPGHLAAERFTKTSSS